MQVYTYFVASLPVTLERAGIGLVLHQLHDVHFGVDCYSTEPNVRLFLLEESNICFLKPDSRAESRELKLRVQVVCLQVVEVTKTVPKSLKRVVVCSNVVEFPQCSRV